MVGRGGLPAARRMNRRLAGAPISWGVSELPGWGHLVSRERVLREIAGLGLEATELGPEGFLPDDLGALRDLLDRHRLRLSGGFVALELRRGISPALDAARRAALRLSAGGAEVFVSAVFADLNGSPPPELDDAGWPALLDLLSRVEAIACDQGLRHVMHPHVGTLVETEAEVRRVLDHSGVALCLDTGHLALGGTDPLSLARAHPERVGLVHLKDVDPRVAERMRGRQGVGGTPPLDKGAGGTPPLDKGAGGIPPSKQRLSFTEAVRQGLFRPLGEGGIPVSDVLAALEGAGYDGWYVLEQDVALRAEPAEGEGPLANVRASLAYLEGIPRVS